MRKSPKSSYFNPAIVRTVGIILFIGTLIMQGQIQRNLESTSTVGAINGIISQIQVLIAVAIVVMIPKKGFFTSLVMCIFNSIYILVFGVLLSRDPGASPGVLSPLITIVVCTLIHYYSLMSYKAQDELERRNSELIDTNDRISKEGERLSRIVYNDDLTGLYNQDMFAKHISEIMNSDDINPFTVVYTEIDKFNDLVKTHGDEAGNIILTTFGYRLHNFCGNSGFAARIDNAKFAFIITGQRNREAVTSYLSDLIAEVCEPVNINGKLQEITITSGITHYPRDGKNAETLMANTDNALTYAKEKENSGVYFFS